MGKQLPSPTNLQRYARLAVETIRRAKIAKHAGKSLASGKEEAAAATSRGPGRWMDERERQQGRVPLKDVVADCTRRWFQDALKEARAGDAAMQVLVGQMYHSGYGVPRNEQKVRFCYNASDSDSDEEKMNMKS
ncbi:hypothetical protein B296_00018929 [Ensete ventricosum]|uniref:Uncharacterized protein n=1 Tax=Ensete ventricosum TaxID=4639 RepID=A0A427AU64_ENSVE|nr:hypothetical protein B296_00018929 [Ensete ventricosum]